MDEWDNKNNGTGPDAEQTDSANDTHIENNADQMPPYTQQAPYQSSFGAGGYYQQGGPSQNQQGQQPYQSPYQYNQAPASGGGPDGSGPQKKKKKTGLIVLIVILCVALVAAGIGIAIGLTRDDDGDSGNKAVNPPRSMTVRTDRAERVDFTSLRRRLVNRIGAHTWMQSITHRSPGCQ